MKKITKNKPDKITNQYALETKLINLGTNPAEQYGFVNPPIYRGSTVLYSDINAMEETLTDPLKNKLPTYGRFGSPTCRDFESALTELEGGIFFYNYLFWIGSYHNCNSRMCANWRSYLNQ